MLEKSLKMEDQRFQGETIDHYINRISTDKEKADAKYMAQLAIMNIKISDLHLTACLNWV